MLGMRRPLGLFFLVAVSILLQTHTVAAKKKAAKKSHGDLAQDGELVNGNPWALLIDAGSGGSRLHLYEWEPRVYHTLPPPISKPFTSEVWRLYTLYRDDTQLVRSTNANLRTC
jgi:hypothetical protein